VTVGHEQQLPTRVIWHELECGAYAADLSLWRALADEHGDPVLDIGAGAGRTALDLARHGHQVTALDSDPLLLAELARRADRLPISTVVADAREFELGQRFPLIIVPMQTIQLLGGRDGRRRFLTRAACHLLPDGVLAAALTQELEPFSVDDGIVPPTPDMREIEGVVYSSQPTAVREDRHGFTLERMRERIGADGKRSAEYNVVRLDGVTAAELEREATAAGLRPESVEVIPPTGEHVGSVVVKLVA
jgi:SAM-dependent methyltransferase